MEKFLKIFLLLLLGSGFISCFSQSTTVVTGRVLDKTTRKGLNDANVRFKGSFVGVRTDSLGWFKINTTQKIRTILISYLGYKVREIDIQPGKINELAIELSPAKLELGEVIVKPTGRYKREIDTTALYIFHQVVKYKSINRAGNIPSYYYKEYNKTVYSQMSTPKWFTNLHSLRPVKYFFDNTDTTDDGEYYNPLLLQEEYREAYYSKKPEKKLNIVHYCRISGVKSPYVAKLIKYHFEVTDVYDNGYVFFMKSFEAPFSSGATALYNYHVIDTAKIDGRTSYRLNFVGKNREDLCLRGYAWIDSADWAIQFISFRPSERANLNFVNDMLIEQTFNLVAPNAWLMSKERWTLEANPVKGARRFSLMLDKTTLRKDILCPVIIPDSLAKRKDDLVEADAYEKRFEYMDSIRFDTLNKSERTVYHNFDTLKRIPAYNRLKFLGELITQINLKAGPVDFGRLYRIASRNNIEGYRFRMGVNTNSDLSDKIFIGAYAAYGTKDDVWKYATDFRFLIPASDDRWQAIEIVYKKDMLVLGQENPLLTYDNIFTLLGGTTLTKVMKTESLNVFFERDWVKGLSSIFTFTDMKFYSIPGVFTFATSDGKGGQVAIPLITTNEISASLRYCKTDNYFVNTTFRTPLPTQTPSITFKYTVGIKNNLLGGDYTYHKFTVEFLHRIQWPVIGYSKVKIRTGYTLGTTPYPLSFISSSNIGFVRDDYSFQSTAPFEFVTDKFFMVWWEHHFDGFFLNRIPLVNRLNIREFVQCKALIGGYSDQNVSSLTLPSGMFVPGPVPYVEIGFGFENILKALQINFLWRCTYMNNPNVANFLIKLGIEPGF